MLQVKARYEVSAAGVTQETSTSLHQEPAEGGGASEMGWMPWSTVGGNSFLASVQNVLCWLNGGIKCLPPPFRLDSPPCVSSSAVLLCQVIQGVWHPRPHIENPSISVPSWGWYGP